MRCLVGIMAHNTRITSLGMNSCYVSSISNIACITGSFDQTARLWTIDGILVSILNGHIARISSTSFHPGGRLCLTSSIDYKWKIWDIEFEKVVMCGEQNFRQKDNSRGMIGFTKES